jgi:hypothetical protein
VLRTCIAFLLFFTLLLPPVGQLNAQEENAIRTANYFLLSGSTLNDQETLETLALYDLIVIPAEAQVFNQTFANEIRSLNPDIKILAYIPSVSWNTIWTDSLHAALHTGIEDSFWLKNAQGEQVSIWPGTQALDLTSGWNEYLANFVAEQIIQDNNYWDGIFYDEVSDEITWLDNVQLSIASNNLDESWRDAYTDLFEETRRLIGDEKIIISNGSSNLQHAPYVNGRMFESFPTPWEAGGDWNAIMDQYFTLEAETAYQPTIILNSDTDNTGDSSNYQKVRFGLASTLLSGGYFGFDFGTQSHQQLWRYDEYDAFIGAPTDNAIQNDGGIWERDFTNGRVLVNPTDQEQTIRLDGEFEKIHGTQDTSVNDGSIIYRVTLNPWDGILLLRPIEKIDNGVFFNGAFARIFDRNGEAYRTGFFAYDSDYYGGMQIITYDIDLDGNLETIAADANQVFIYNEDGSLHASFYPYTSTYQGGVNISVGDLENDGSIEIVTGTENGGGAHVRVFNADGVLINPGFFAYDEAFRGGVNITIGDLNNDGWYEIIAGAGVGGGPHIRVFNKHGEVINPGFFAFDEYFRGGVNVSAGDINGDGIDEIIAGPGYGGAPEVRVFDKDGNWQTTPFYAFDESERRGVEVSSSDIDGDGIFEIIALTRDVFTLSGL